MRVVLHAAVLQCMDVGLRLPSGHAQGLLGGIRDKQRKLQEAHERTKTVTRTGEMKGIRERMQARSQNPCLAVCAGQPCLPSVPVTPGALHRRVFSIYHVRRSGAFFAPDCSAATESQRLCC